jgi:hypothetical protein
MQGSSAPRDSRPDSQVATSARRHSKGRSEGPSYELGGKRLRVRVALGACLVASAPGIAGGARGMALSVAVLLSALFAHELGHALSALAFGARATVVLSVKRCSSRTARCLSSCSGLRR